ncbi:diacylglyceryl transferase [Myroides odoratimimus]|uniref:Diacylglyceryl transferase n=4 Tax=Myroides TaxID=76831 RepID=A0A0S7EFN7_9FLAO|nr:MULTISPECIES: DUF6787 family protein [Myroides]AJA67249.1 hypothetical protein MYRA21_0004 [Myroides sp. A21]AJH15802.1 diacylglyceryl transferase [Myroides profundi]ALU27532.1 diacylglyceryl transferase [Myroides odoratimimus]APA90667.1 diacylglyceryl transferase [Myroides sp. ZB35]EHO07575.1 hypothetical protein HMPREF9714_02655 [Myroides odoratimimus CCUG 12901]
MEKLKQRWGITSNWQMGVILLVFAITGSTAAYISKPILTSIGLDRATTNPFIYWVLYIVLILPVYKVILICVGTIFGQHRFFWNFVMKMLRRMGFGSLVPKDK